MSTRVTFRKNDDPKWKRESSCDVPTVGDIICMVPNADILDINDSVSYLVHSVRRVMIAIEFPGEIEPGQAEGTLLPHAIEVMLIPLDK